MLVLFGYFFMLMIVTDATETVSLKQTFFFVVIKKNLLLC